MSRISLTLLLCVCSLYAWSQAYTNPSPDATGLVKFANTNVNYYTGTPEISIPLTELKSRELSLPVSLSYNASGFKVSEVASFVGLGWSLNAGGAISRVVRGLPDELADGYCGTNDRGEQAGASTGTDSFADHVADGTYDGEPDIFYFTLPGKSGQFVLDAQGFAFTIPYQDISITPAICGGNGEWTIIDENGVVYKFGSTTNSREQTTSWVVSQPWGSSRTYISSWYLTKIISPNSTDEIDFTYTGGSIKYSDYFHTKMEDTSACNVQVNDDTYEDNSIIVSSIYPSSITCGQGTLSFEWGGRRQDLVGGLYLKSISLTNHSSLLVHKNKFSYSYFTASGCVCPDEALCKRLRLDAVYDLAPDPMARFTYYSTTTLPARNSKNFDHWGYYNANTVDSWIPYSFKGDTHDTDENHSYSGAIRVTDPEKTKANVLTRIDSRGGGYQAFTYQAHSVYSVAVADNVLVGGVRIASIQSNDGNGITITRNFGYLNERDPSKSSGLAFYIPSYYAFRINSHTFKRFSSALTSLFDITGAHVGYSRVTETVSGFGSTTYYFSNFDSNPDGGAKLIFYGPNYIPTTSKGWERGNLVELKAYDASGALVKRQVNRYRASWPTKRELRAWVMTNKSYLCQTSPDYDTSHYQVVSRPYTLSRQITELYDPASSLRKISKVSYFEYDPVTLQNIRKSDYDSTSRTTMYVSDMKYVTNADYYHAQTSGVDCESQYQGCMQGCDEITNPAMKASCLSGCISDRSTCLAATPSPDPPAAAILKLKNRHQTSAPVEIRTTFVDPSGSKVISSTVNIFSISGSTVNLIEKWNMNQALASGYTNTSVATNGTFLKDNTYLRKTKTFNSYSSAGNLAQMTNMDGVVTNYTYDANNLLATAVVSGGIGSGFHSGTSTFTNATLLGKTSEADENGLTTNYEYDGYGRLHIIKNGTDIIGRRLSHYKNETPGSRSTDQQRYS